MRSTIVITLMLLVAQAVSAQSSSAYLDSSRTETTDGKIIYKSPLFGKPYLKMNGQKIAAYRIDSAHAGGYRYFSYVKKNGKFLLGRLQSEGQLITLLDIPSANGRFNLGGISAKPKGGYLAFVTDTTAKDYNKMPNPLHDGSRRNGVLKTGKESNRKLKEYLLSDEASASLYRSSKFYRTSSVIVGIGGVGLVIGGIVVSSSEGSSTTNSVALLGGGALSMFLCQTLSNAALKQLTKSVAHFNSKHPRLVHL